MCPVCMLSEDRAPQCWGPQSLQEGSGEMYLPSARGMNRKLERAKRWGNNATKSKRIANWKAQ